MVTLQRKVGWLPQRVSWTRSTLLPASPSGTAQSLIFIFFPSKADAAPARIYRDTWQDIRVAILKPTCSKGAKTASADLGLSFLVKTRQPQTCCAFCVMVTCRSLSE